MSRNLVRKVGGLDAGQVRPLHRVHHPLLRTMVELTDAVEPYNPQEEIEEGLFRVGLPRYTDATLRELIANALAHRDYAVRGQVRVAIEDGTLTIANPGEFPAGERRPWGPPPGIQGRSTLWHLPRRHRAERH